MARLRIGLTGGIASGKSTVAAILADLGAVVIDADVLAREVVEPGTPGLQQIVDRFGDHVLCDGRLDRPALGRIIFDDAEARADLEAIVHPAVRRRSAEQEAAAGPDAVIVAMIPLLTETGQAGDFDSVWVVDATEEAQVARLARRDGMTREEAQRRISAQARRADRLAVADVVIQNPDPVVEPESVSARRDAGSSDPGRDDDALAGDRALRDQVVRAYRSLPAAMW